MAIVRWNDPFAGLTTMHSQLDDLFNNFFSANLQPAAGAPAMDVYTEDDNKALVAEVHVPGFTKDDIEVNVHDGVLELKGEKHQKTEDTDKKRSYMMRESHASFYRSIALPRAADGDSVEAQFVNGVLKVRVPFKELPAARRITIGDGQTKK